MSRGGHSEEPQAVLNEVKEESRTVLQGRRERQAAQNCFRCDFPPFMAKFSGGFLQEYFRAGT